MCRGHGSVRSLCRSWSRARRSADYEGLSLDALAEYEAGLAIAPGDTALRRARDQERHKLLTEP